MQGFYYPYKLDKFDLDERETFGIAKEMVGLLCYFNKAQKIYQIVQRLPFLNKLLPVLVTHDNYAQLVVGKNSDLIVSGYFQKYGFFEDYEEIIRKKLTYRRNLTEANQSFYTEIIRHKTISVHIRRGDYVEKVHVANNFSKITPGYFERAIDFISSKTQISKLVIFSDDIQWVKENIKFGYECIYIDNDGPDFEHQFLMSCCDHNIISNSTFSWWAAWLNENENKIVCVPDKWFADKERKDDIYIPYKWAKLEN